MIKFSFNRFIAVIFKEILQMLRDKATFALLIGVTLAELILFGFAINNNPRYIPTAVVNSDNTEISRRIIASLANSTYFYFVSPKSSEQEANRLFRTGKVQFVITFPTNFTRDLIRGKHPRLLIEADTTDPASSTRAIEVFNDIANTSLNENLKGSLSSLLPKNPPYQPIVHAAYNPLAITAYNIVPGLLGEILTMTMVVVTALVITRESERGTMETLLSMPLNSLEVMIGKLVPYIMIGLIQVVLILVLAKVVFFVPMEGSIVLLVLFTFPFIIANLAVGLIFSTLASNQLQAVQSAIGFLMPSILLSGFIFPFRGMPEWAQYLGNILPLTHYLNIVRGIMLKGNTFSEIYEEAIPIILFTIVVLYIGIKRFRKTLD